MVCLAEPMLNRMDFPLNFLRYINVSIIAFNFHNGVSKMWISFLTALVLLLLCLISSRVHSAIHLQGYDSFIYL